MLESSELSRINNFDLLLDKGWEALTTDIAEDFPYLTLFELTAIVKMGCKGKLDKYKSSPLNYTRIYQWVEQRAPFCLSFWQHHHGPATAWATHCLGEETLLAMVAQQPDPAGMKRSLYHSLIRRETEKRLEMDGTAYPSPAHHQVHQSLTADFARWAAKYPAYHTRHHYELFQ
ncbi:hypothetical protein [Hymenobacter lapidiphilus]|uniref:Uncharacterized protein n=1 Tax=Hymenobacter lapidiphilus TaxID=2608003 RepID=A0A7Y7PSZ7_9BACT|nr:hypothetical protein [Hymenobacter lapidiphilus]NVO33483.1 hypothetical protein [Hymenobacter lapidiphilus]